MANIVPLYDFETRAVPTRATLRQQANSLTITGVGLDELAVGIRPVLLGTTSGATGALIPGSSAVGTLWRDPRGELWVQEQSGPVKIYRYEGGWETRRYYMGDLSGHGARPPGTQLRSRSGGPTENHERTELTQGAILATEPRLSSTRESMADNDASIYLGLQQDSNFTGYRRWCGRGGSLIHPLLPTPSATFLLVSEMRGRSVLLGGGVSSVNWAWDQFHDGSTIQQQSWAAWPSVPVASSSTVSAASNDHTIKTNFFGWCFGVPLKTLEVSA